MSESLKIHGQWRPVHLTKDGEGYLFPTKFTRYILDEYARPAVYRWRVFPAEAGQKEQVYIGEAEILSKRALSVLRAAKGEGRDNTNWRLRTCFETQVKSGKHIALEWLDFQPFEIECARFEARELWDPFKRKCIENLALVMSADQCEILNIYKDPIGKTLKKFLGVDIPANRLREVVEQIRLAKSTIITQEEARKLVVRPRL